MKAENSLIGFFDERLAKLQVRADTLAYIIALLNDFKRATNDLSKESLTLAYFDAVRTGEFAKFQRIGDWVLFAASIVPQSITEHQLVISIGQRSYASCARIMKGEWVLYEELALELPRITLDIQRHIALVSV